MTIDAGYEPVRDHAPIGGEVRVMMLDDLDDKEKARLKRAINKARRIPEPEALPVYTSHEWWCSTGGALHDFFESAQNVADNTGIWQTIHIHAHGTPCKDRDHHTVVPNEGRMKAVGGNKRG